MDTKARTDRKTVKRPAPAPAKAKAKPARTAKEGADRTEGHKVAPVAVVPAVVPELDPVAAFACEVFSVGDMAVHPSHGVGQIEAMEDRDLAGKRSTCYVMRIGVTGLKVVIPTEAAPRVGLRPVMRQDQAREIIDILRAPEVAVDVQPWNRRFRAYTEMLKSGLPTEIAKVLRDMYRLKFDKDLSFGERRLLDQARSLLVQELALATRVQPEHIEGEIQAIFSS